MVSFPQSEPRAMRILEVTHVQNPTVGWARRNGVIAIKLQGMGNRSMPDYLFLLPGGRAFMIEFKAPGKAPSPLQWLTIQKLIDQGFDVEVHDTKQSAIAALRERLTNAGRACQT